MTGLDARIARLEAAEAVRSVFAQYTQLMDAGHIDELMQVFGPGAELVAMNEPSTGGGTVRRTGHAEIEAHYRALRIGTFRHHATGVSVDVSPDAKVAEISSLFITSYRHALKGGLYEVRLGADAAGAWKIARLHITSSWGWHVADARIDYFGSFAPMTLRGGRPVVWGRTLADR